MIDYGYGDPGCVEDIRYDVRVTDLGGARVLVEASVSRSGDDRRARDNPWMPAMISSTALDPAQERHVSGAALA